MKRAKWWMGLWLALCLAAGLSVPSVHGAKVTVDGVTWKYKTSGGKATVTGASPAKGALTIPSKLAGYPVTEIGEFAFQNCSGLTSVKIPVGVTNIGKYAFNYCTGMKSVVIPEGVASIGYEAFLGCGSLTSLAIPASVTHIDTEPFSECGSLKSFKVAAGNRSYKSVDGVLFTKDGKKLVCCPGGKTGSYVIPNGVTNIEWFAFSWCTGLTSVKIPDSVTYIGFHAFQSCTGLKTLTIPASVAYLEFSALIGLDSLKTLYVPKSWKSKYVNGTFWSTFAAVPSGCKVVYVRLKLAASSRTFSAAAAGGQKLAVTANVKWKAKSSAKWLKVKTASGSGNGTIKYDVAANKGTKSRTGKITVKGGGVTRKFKVTQKGLTKQVTTFKGNGGTPATQVTTNRIGKAYGKLPSAKWSGHALVGWFTKAEGGKQVKTNSTVTVAAKRTLYAHWTKKQVTTFKGNGGTPSTQKTTNTVGKTYGTLPAPKRAGYKFDGWYTKAEGGTKVTGKSTVTAVAKRTLYAHWTVSGAKAKGPAITRFSVGKGVAARSARGRSAGGTMDFVAEKGSVYELQWTPVLGGGWRSLGRWVAGEDGEGSIDLPGIGDSPAGFYRLAVPAGEEAAE